MESSTSEKADGLEIISIGALYVGPWGKKYWSSSRGKDRYPFPIGYQAVRTHVGDMYKMEICEGVKGPLFLVSSSDGKSGSGQTPDIAWEHFQKKSNSKVKMWHGKRFSCKIDGVELFGFRNPLVQRLLRELVANVNGMAEQSFVSANFCNGALTIELDAQHPDSFRYPDLLPCLGKQQITGKRSRKHKSTSKDTVALDGVKRSRSHHRQGNQKNVMHVDNTLRDQPLQNENPQPDLILSQKESILDMNDRIPYPTGLEHHNHGKFQASVTSDDNCTLQEEPETLLGPLDLPVVAERENAPVLDKDDLLVVEASPSFDPFLEEHVVSQDRSKLVAPEDYKLPWFSHEVSGENNMLLDRSSDSDVHGVDPIMPKNDNNKEEPIPTESKSMEALDLCVLDTLDLLQDNVAASPLRSHIRSPCVVEKEEGTYPDTSSDRSEFDSISQELAKSMMTVLLPQALPLLTKTSRKKKANIQNTEDAFIKCDDLCLNLDAEKIVGDSKGTGCHTAVVSQGAIAAEIPFRASNIKAEDKVQILGVLTVSGTPSETNKFVDPACVCNNIQTQGNSGLSDIPVTKREDSEDAKSVIPDSFEDDQCFNDVTGQIPLPSMFCEVDQIPTNKSECGSDNLNFSGDIYVGISSHCDSENDKNNAVPCSQEKEMNFSDNNGGVAEALFLPDLLPHMKSATVNDCKTLPSRTELSQKNPVQESSFSNVTLPDKKCGGFVELVGCYMHPLPVRFILLNSHGDDIYICVLCGLLEENDRTLFVYNVPIKDMIGKCPRFLSYTTIALPHFEDALYREVALDRTGLQFTPDGQFLVFLDSVKAPHCRKQDINCVCSVCTLDFCEGNAVKVVSVKLGYVSTVAKLKTDENVYHVLVCEPSYLVVAGESGRLHVWVMNSLWSGGEEFILQSFDYSPPAILELKRIPRCEYLILGHNGKGGFGFWDISRRVLVAKLSNLGSSLLQVLPLGLISKEVTSCEEGPTKEIVAASGTRLPEAARNDSSCASDGDMAMWLVVSTALRSDTRLNTSTVGYWRLALLVKSMLIVGSILDPRASAADVSGGCGIIGTHDGLVYMWEISTGRRLADLHDFKGGSVSCITTDPNSGTFAVAGGNSQVLVYIHTPRA